jgi:hypothetical protein
VYAVLTATVQTYGKVVAIFTLYKELDQRTSRFETIAWKIGYDFLVCTGVLREKTGNNGE